jgi:hypothetical protein
MNLRVAPGELLIQGTASFPVARSGDLHAIALVSVADESASDSSDRIAMGNIAAKHPEFVSDRK